MAEQSLNFARKGIRPVSKLIILSIVSIALMMLDSRYSAVQYAKGYAATALYPLQWLANQPVRLYAYAASFMQSQSSLLAENRRLHEENGRLKTQMQQTGLLQRELSELKTLQALQNSGLAISGSAEVISNGKDPLSDKLIIDKGSRNGLKTGDAVIDQHGLIGQLTQVQPFSAELTLITNSQTVVPVMVARTGVRSLLYGSGGALNLRYFPVDADLRPEDILLTSGLDSIYPAGIPVARITAAARAQGTPYYRVSVAPLAAFRSSKYVLTLPQQPAPAQLGTPKTDPSAARP
ncbi:rod shape-determining protein MreC [Uruburuella testudinis]|uniref:Cell shape-determining protein MreC n=1 Tax=Uruburuella testudinis TaxID=1282863 RepID=A0ABY4DRT9_9NEIS|nr:rod shape-determining protein MreC [Uruburuella testudinis]UOO81449.1 rod shape-determining protein MreC [Uruburuella testudinis]